MAKKEQPLGSKNYSCRIKLLSPWSSDPYPLGNWGVLLTLTDVRVGENIFSTYCRKAKSAV